MPPGLSNPQLGPLFRDCQLIAPSLTPIPGISLLYTPRSCDFLVQRPLNYPFWGFVALPPSPSSGFELGEAGSECRVEALAWARLALCTT